jgi:5-methylcytosine-specific restriction endonuclease McrA
MPTHERGWAGPRVFTKCCEQCSERFATKRCPACSACEVCGKPKWRTTQRTCGAKCGAQLVALEKRGRTRPDIRGDRHWNWKGGVSSETQKKQVSAEYRSWRRAVYERDNWTCRKCRRKRGIRINAHHIWPWAEHPELRYDVSNGVTLCVSCHTREHSGAQATLRAVTNALA